MPDAREAQLAPAGSLADQEGRVDTGFFYVSLFLCGSELEVGSWEFGFRISGRLSAIVMLGVGNLKLLTKEEY